MRTALEPRPHGPEPAPGLGIPSSLLALAAVASRLGLDLSVEQLMRRFALEPGEPETATLIAIAREVGLEAQTLNMRFDELPRLARALPAILRAKDGGALILEAAHSDPAKGTVVVIRDPKEAEDALVAIDELHLAEVWMGEAILVKRRYAISDEQQPFGGAWLFGQVMRERTIFKQVGLAALVSTIFALAPPFAFMITINRVLPNTSYSTLGVIAGALVIMMVFETILNHVRRILTQVVSTRVDGRLGLYIMEKVLRLPMDYFEHNPTGRIIEKLGSVWLIRHFLTGQLFGAFLDAVPLLGLIPAMLLLNWELALIAFGLSGIIFVVVLVFMKPMHRLYHKVIMAEQAKSSHLVETLHGIRTIKSLSLEGRRRKEWDRLVATVTETRHAFGLLANYPQTIITPLERLIYSGSFVVGAYLVLNAQSVTSPVTTATTMLPGAINLPAITNLQSAGGLVAFVMLASRLASPLVQLASLQRDLAEVRMALGQIGQVVNVPPEESRVNGTRLPVKGEVSFKDVCFRYAPGAPYALEDVNLTVPAGTNLGIMGRSGSGKTTVTRLLQRLNQSYEGMIKIDGVDLREMDLMHLRTHIGVVPQENFLFSGTIRENIAMARPEASFGDVIKAAQLSGAEEFIERQPRGYDTMLEEGATNLSGGQRQRLALARALLIDPPILILDEATSALDAESEAIVSANLKRMAKGRTVLSISHRLSMLVDCDAIVVLERGRVYDIGTHEELVRRCDIYKHMWFQQNRHLDPTLADKTLVVSRGAAR